MRTRLLLMTAFFMALGAGFLYGELGVGDQAAQVEATGFLNTEVKSLDELKGKLVLYEYFAHW